MSDLRRTQQWDGAAGAASRGPGRVASGGLRGVCVVTGAAGFIGSRLCARLLAEGWRVVGLDGFTDSYSALEKRERAGALARHPGFELAAGDLATMGLAECLAGVEVVFHLAGRAGVRPSFELGPHYEHDNVTATRRLLAACQAGRTVRRVVHASSSSVYGAAAVPFSEDADPAPISPYGCTKLAAERLCLAASGPSLETVALRLFTVYGPGQRPDMALRRFAEAGLAGGEIELLGDGSQTGTSRMSMMWSRRSCGRRTLRLMVWP